MASPRGATAPNKGKPKIIDIEDEDDDNIETETLVQKKIRVIRPKLITRAVSKIDENVNKVENLPQFVHLVKLNLYSEEDVDDDDSIRNHAQEISHSQVRNSDYLAPPTSSLNVIGLETPCNHDQGDSSVDSGTETLEEVSLRIQTRKNCRFLLFAKCSV